MQGDSLKTPDGSHTDRFKYGYDRNSSRLYRDNLLNDSFDELYHANGASAGYDQLNQLTDFRRGALSDTNSDNIPDTVTSPTRQQGWDFDALGNFDTQTTDGTPQTRTHNKQNQSTVVGGNNLTFDANGNTTKDETGKTYSFDAFNRLVLAKDSGGSTIATYNFDALGRRIVETVSGTTRDIYFTPGWQVIEEQISGSAKTQYVWSPVYIDALIARDRDADGNGSLEERLYAQQDANFNVTSVISSSGSVVERFVYDPYGSPTFLNASWTNSGSSAYAWTILHQGGRYEPVTGLYLFRHRDYSPTLARWLENDPAGFLAEDTNFYRYVSNAPLQFADPTGLDGFWLWNHPWTIFGEIYDSARNNGPSETYLTSPLPGTYYDASGFPISSRPGGLTGRDNLSVDRVVYAAQAARGLQSQLTESGLQVAAGAAITDIRPAGNMARPPASVRPRPPGSLT